MRASLIVLLTALAVLPQGGTSLPSASMEADVDRLVRAAEKLTGSWPKQAPPPIPEVALVARHGTRVAPLLLPLLSDDPDVQRDPKRWKVQQQAALTLCRVYSESNHCGRAYCDGDNPERIARVRESQSRAWTDRPAPAPGAAVQPPANAIATIAPAGLPARGNPGLSARDLGRSGDQRNRAGPPPPCAAGDACCRSAMVGFCRVGCPEPHTLPVPISRPAPDVSTPARPLPAGVAILEIGIDKDGHVVSACVLRSVRDDFDRAAQAAALRSLWRPLLLKGQPIGAVITVTFPTADKAGGRDSR